MQVLYTYGKCCTAKTCNRFLLRYVCKFKQQHLSNFENFCKHFVDKLSWLQVIRISYEDYFDILGLYASCCAFGVL